MYFLTVTTPEGTSFRQGVSEETTHIGRSSTNEIVIHDLDASRTHARIERRSDAFLLADMGSKNGTFVNGRRLVTPVGLRGGDRIRIGRTVIFFSQAGASDDDGSATPEPEVRTPTVDGLSLPDSASVTYLEKKTPVPAAGRNPGAAVESHITTPPPESRFGTLLLAAEKRLACHHSLAEILEAVMDLAQKAVGYERGLLFTLDDGELICRVMRGPTSAEGRNMSHSRTIASKVLGTGQPILIPETLTDATCLDSPSISEQGIHSVMCVPLQGEREMNGLVYVDRRAAPGRFTEGDLHALEFLATLAAIRIENSRLVQTVIDVRADAQAQLRELAEAREIQKRFLPAGPPALAGYALEGDSIPCKEVGGDCYDFAMLPNGRCGLGIGDVSGKGLPAAMVMSHFLACLRTLVSLSLPLDDTIARLNNLLCRSIPENRYVTFFCGELDPARHTLTYLNAGHPPPWILRSDGRAERLDLPHMFLGSFPDLQFGLVTVALQPGDLLVCYSDGVTEAESPAGELFGEERLVTALKYAIGWQPREILDKILAMVDSHCGGAYQDDLTVVLLKRTA